MMIKLTSRGHGNKEIVERVISSPLKAKKLVEGKRRISVSERVARECINIGYGFFTPLEGFMNKADVEAVCKKMRLTNGVLWSIPIVLDVSSEEIEKEGIEEGEKVLLIYNEQPLALLNIEEIFKYDKMDLARDILGTTDMKHPGVKIYKEMKDTFIGGKITLVNIPIFNPPFNRFWYTPKKIREKFVEKGWRRIVAHQTRNVPHRGHEWLMKAAWFATNGELPVERPQTGILVNCVIGMKKIGDYIDEAIVLCHQQLQDSGYIRSDIHMVSIVLWDMRYAGPREAIFHAILRSNLGCTHHMFGRDHAGVGNYYGPYDAHRIFDEIPENALNIKPVRLLDWWYCPVCDEIGYSGFCGHHEEKQEISGTMIRGVIKNGSDVKSLQKIMRPEVFNKMMECANKYGFGSPFCTEQYLAERQPVFKLQQL